MENDIISILEEVGVFLPDDSSHDEITDFFDDSLQFMTFIVKLEEKFGVEFPNEYLLFDNFASMNNIIAMINELKEC